MKWLACLVVLAPVFAHAGPTKKTVEWTLTNRGDDADTAVRFGFDSQGVNENARTWKDADRDRRDLIELRDPTIATAADGKSAWVATGARRGTQCAGLKGTIDQCKSDEEPAVNALVLYDQDGKKWNPVAVHSAIPVTAKDQAKRIADGVKLGAIVGTIDTRADGAVLVFKTTIGDPKLLAASVSARKDVVLFGSAPKEKFVGGAKVKATLAKWKLALAVRDGVVAGATASETVAWVAANVDARPADKPGAAPTPYRLLCLYELEKGKDWRLVAMTFSYPTPPAP